MDYEFSGKTTAKMGRHDSQGTIVFKTEWFNVEELDSNTGNSQNSDPYYRINAPDGVIVLAITQDDKILLVRQWRPALKRYTIELPAGAIDPDELPEHAASRELYEETGFVCREMTLVGNGFLSANRINADNFAFFGLGATLRETFVPREDIEPVLVTPNELKNLVLSGKFKQWAALSVLLLADWQSGTKLAYPEAGFRDNTNCQSPISMSKTIR